MGPGLQCGGDLIGGHGTPIEDSEDVEPGPDEEGDGGVEGGGVPHDGGGRGARALSESCSYFLSP